MKRAGSSKFHPHAHLANEAILKLESALGSRKAVGALFKVNPTTIASWLDTKVPTNRVQTILDEAKKRNLIP